MLTRISLCFEDAADLFTRILCIPLIYDIPKRSKIIVCLIFTVYVVIDRYKAYIPLRQHNFGIIPDHDIISAETRHIFNNDRTYKSIVHIIHHPKKVRTVEVCSTVSVVHIKSCVFKAALFRISR